MLVFWAVTPCGFVGRYYRFGEAVLKMGTVCLTETLAATYKSTRRYNPEDQEWRLHRHEILKPHSSVFFSFCWCVWTKWCAFVKLGTRLIRRDRLRMRCFRPAALPLTPPTPPIGQESPQLGSKQRCSSIRTNKMQPFLFPKYTTQRKAHVIFELLECWLLNPWNRHADNAEAVVVKTFPAFYGNKSFITVFTESSPRGPACNIS
jgi:hypothetical protein